LETADIVIIGGGVLGGSVAYYLAKQAPGRVLLLERHQVAQGNSSLAAGLLTRGRLYPDLIPVVRETYQAIVEIEETTGDSLGMRRTGCLYAGISPAHQKEICKLASVSSQAGLKVESLDSIDASHLVSWLKLPHSTFLIYMPEDGYIDGYTLASGYIKAARLLGVEIREQTAVLSIQRTGDRITGVETTQGPISASIVIDAAGVWAGMLAYEIGIGLPMAPVRSHYWITASHTDFSADQPFVILPDARAYARPEGARLLFGFREPQSVSVDPRELPDRMSGYTFRKDPNGWESLTEGIPEFGKFFPLVEEIEISSYIRGLSNYTPDGRFVLGTLPGVEGFLAATGCAGAGIAMSGGIGRAVSELALGRPPFIDLAPHRVDRFGAAINPMDPELLQRCADARSGKITG
jgi:sarcosine oxidase, subunit beta